MKPMCIQRHDLDDVRFKMHGLVMKLEQFFPIIKAHIENMSEKHINLSCTTHDGAREGTKLIVMPADKNDVLYVNDKPVELIISKATKTECRGQSVARKSNRTSSSR